MCNATVLRRCIMRLARALTLVAILATPRMHAQAPAAPTPTRPPSAAEIAALADSVNAMRARAAEARGLLAAAEARVREIPDDSLSLSGALLLFKAADLPKVERTRLERSFARTAERVQAAFGESGRTLLAETRWQLVVVQRVGRFERPFVQFAPMNNSRRARTVLRFPLDENAIEALVMGEVGERLVARHPMLETWLSGTFFLTDEASSHYIASRALVVQGNERARRCLRGSIEDCAIILDPARQSEWYVDPRERRTFPPASPGVRASLVHFAIAKAGPALLPALEAAADSVPAVTVLAQSVGLSPDEFLTQWHAAIIEVSTTRAHVAPRLLLSSVGWIVFFGFLATRRRQR